MAVASQPVRVAVASCSFDADLVDPEALLERYHAMTGWAEAVAGAGADAVTVVQRFGRDAVLRRRAVEYRFVADGADGAPPGHFVGARVARVIGGLGPDVVHVDGLVFPAVVGCLRLRLPRRTAIVVQDHGGVRLPWRGLGRTANRLLYGLGLGTADGFFFTADAQAQPWREAGVIRERHAVYEVPESSTDMASWPAAAADGALPGDPAILWVARLDDNKDPLTILDGFAGAAAALPRATLTLVYGDDVLLPAVQTWIDARPELKARIHLRGRVARAALPACYRSADLFVIGSHREVACFALIEALSFGVTPVVTDIPAFRAITAGGRIGALFPPGDTRTLARAIETAGNGDRAARRASVRAHFERELSWAAVGRRALDAYRSAAAARRSYYGRRGRRR
ncbi:MAG TPA: glycosyltransferase family 4 protein [Polyangia bacterium]|nr:glycosyltransferase family 4 protein [Polyangia bacterium]